MLPVPGLVERATETSALEHALEAAARGDGGTLLLSGPAGVGKSSLLRHAREVASSSGYTVLGSSPTPVSAGLAHGVVRDWIGPLVRRRGSDGRPFDGPAAGLADALAATPDDLRPDDRVWSLASLDYALSWVLDAVTEEGPLLLTVDDVQWADDGSLQVLDLLAARLPDTPVLLLLARRLGEESERPDVLDRLGARATVITPKPLTVAGVAAMRRDLERPGRASPLTSEELHGRTGGVPYLVREVLRADPGHHAAPPTVVEAVNDRLRRLGDTATAVARTVALLGDDADLDTVATLCDTTLADLADPLDRLGEAEIVTVVLWRARTAHPLVAEAVVASMAPSERSALHRRAADHLAARGCSRQVVASHLVHTLPEERPDTVALLRAAGVESLESGAPETAASQLLRAVGETRAEDTETDLLRLAARAHVLAGSTDDAFDLWARALDRLTDPAERAECLADVGDARMSLGARDAARSCYEEAATLLAESGVDDTSPELRLLLGRMGMTQALYDGASGILQRTTRSALQQPECEDTHADRVLFALTATALCLDGRDHLQARRLAIRALGGGRLLEEETCDGKSFYVATGPLTWADAYEEGFAALDAAVADSRRRGSLLGFATASYCRGSVQLRRGRLRQAVSDLDAALAMRDRGWQEYVEPTLAGLTMAHVCLGHLSRALELEAELRRVVERGGLFGAVPSIAAGLVRACHGDHEQALTDYRTAASLLGPNLANPAVAEWRELAAWSLAALGRDEEARALASEALERARTFGAPRAVGFALRTMAHLQPPDEALESLTEASARFEECDAGYFLARTRVDLGARWASAPGKRDDGLQLLHEALDFAREHDVPPLARKATRLLRQHGVDVPSAGTSPGDLLTAGERRVVDLAVTGRSNRAIAQELFVTVKAVEWHLSNAYRKLGISSRAQLSAAMSGDPGSSSSSAM